MLGACRMWVIRTPCRQRVSSAARGPDLVLIVGLVLTPDLLRDYLKILPDNDDIEAEDRALEFENLHLTPIRSRQRKQSFEQSQSFPIKSINPWRIAFVRS